MTFDEDSYPNGFFYDSAYREYERINTEYNNLYNRVCNMLLFCGVILTIIIQFLFQTNENSINFSIVGKCFLFLSLLSICVAIFFLGKCLKGEKMTVISASQFRNAEFSNNSESEIKAWLTEQLIDCVEANKNVRERKQKEFDFSLSGFVFGFVMFFVGLMWR